MPRKENTLRQSQLSRERERESEAETETKEIRRGNLSQRKPRTPAGTSEPTITNVKGPLGRAAGGGRTGNMLIGRGLSPYTVEMGVPGFTRHTHFHSARPVYGAAVIS